MKMLLYPFEEQFDVPTLSVEFYNHQGFVSQMVGKDLTGGEVFIYDHSENFGITFGWLTPVSLMISSQIIPDSGTLPLSPFNAYVSFGADRPVYIFMNANVTLPSGVKKDFRPRFVLKSSDSPLSTRTISPSLKEEGVT